MVGEMFNISILKWSKLLLESPPWLEKFSKITTLKQGGIRRKSRERMVYFPKSVQNYTHPQIFSIFWIFSAKFLDTHPNFFRFLLFFQDFFYTHPCPTPSPSFPVTTLIYILWRLRTRCFYKKLERASSSRSFLFFAHL